jgi:hypothetical protein
MGSCQSSPGEAPNLKSLNINSKRQAALFGIYVCDSVAMPVHWYYKVDEIMSDYGGIKGYVAPKD